MANFVSSLTPSDAKLQSKYLPSWRHLVSNSDVLFWRLLEFGKIMMRHFSFKLNLQCFHISLQTITLFIYLLCNLALYWDRFKLFRLVIVKWLRYYLFSWISLNVNTKSPEDQYIEFTPEILTCFIFSFCRWISNSFSSVGHVC